METYWMTSQKSEDALLWAAFAVSCAPYTCCGNSVWRKWKRGALPIVGSGDPTIWSAPLEEALDLL
jgi:hypothetical protein